MEVTTEVVNLGKTQLLITNNGPDTLFVGEVGQDQDGWYELPSGTSVVVNASNHETGVVSEDVSDVGVLIGGAGVFPPSVEIPEVDLTGYVAKSAYDANTILAADTDNTPTALTVAASRVLGRKATGGIAALTGAEVQALLDLSGYISATLFDANTMLVAHSDNTPVAVSIAANQVVGRGNSGNVKGLTPAETAAVLSTEIFTQPQTFNPQTGTSYTLVASDAGKNVTLSNAAAITLTVPQDSAAAIAIGTYIDLYQLGAGQVTVVAGTGATLRVSGLTAKARAQYSRLGLQKVSANTWSLFGDLASS